MQALHTRPSSSYPTCWPRPQVPAWNSPIPVPRIPLVCSRKLLRIDGLGGLAHAAAGLDTADRCTKLTAREPPARRHGGAVIEQGLVLDHHRRSGFVSQHHLELTSSGPPDQARDGLPVALRASLLLRTCASRQGSIIHLDEPPSHCSHLAAPFPTATMRTAPHRTAPHGPGRAGPAISCARTRDREAPATRTLAARCASANVPGLPHLFQAGT